jgi:Domain of unknown function (DU1801)
MAELKTQKNDASVDEFIAGVPDERKRADCQQLVAMMREVTGEQPVMWGTSMVGFGSYHYRYASGRQGDWFRVGFSPRKQNLTLYLMSGFDGEADLLDELGPHSTGKACLYLKRLADVDVDVLRELVRRSMDSSAG